MFKPKNNDCYQTSLLNNSPVSSAIGWGKLCSKLISVVQNILVQSYKAGVLK